MYLDCDVLIIWHETVGLSVVGYFWWWMLPRYAAVFGQLSIDVPFRVVSFDNFDFGIE